VKLAAALAVVPLALAADMGAAQPRSPFPLAVGNRWVLRDDAGTGTTITVQKGLVLRGFPGTADVRVRQVGETTEAWDPTSRRWEPFLRLGAPVGTRYLVDLGDTILWRGVEVTVASRKAVVHDARGKMLRGCISLTFRYRKGVADAGFEELAFAPGIGPVRVVEITIAGSRERLLASYRLQP
jgi:hypothetical protein